MIVIKTERLAYLFSIAVNIKESEVYIGRRKTYSGTIVCIFMPYSIRIQQQIPYIVAASSMRYQPKNIKASIFLYVYTIRKICFATMLLDFIHHILRQIDIHYMHIYVWHFNCFRKDFFKYGHSFLGQSFHLLFGHNTFADYNRVSTIKKSVQKPGII